MQSVSYYRQPVTQSVRQSVSHSGTSSGSQSVGQLVRQTDSQTVKFWFIDHFNQNLLYISIEFTHLPQLYFKIRFSLQNES